MDLLQTLEKEGYKVTLDSKQLRIKPRPRPELLLKVKKSLKALVSTLMARQGAPQGLCDVCHELSWWLSVYGLWTCGVCHPPVDPNVVVEWIGEPHWANGVRLH